jgi:uncharacterized membrane protein
MKASDFFTKEQQDRIKAAIVSAEKETSGEVRVHLESKCGCEVLDRASQIFASLKMHKTKLRNGVLFYVSIDDHKFSVIGDAGINAKVPDGFWTRITNVMESDFRNGLFTEGLEKGIHEAGQQLKIHFPYQKDDKNELSDEISFGK